MAKILTGNADAVMVPERLKTGRRQYHRLDSITAIVAPLLGVCKNRALIYIRQHNQAGEPMLFCTRDSAATLNYPVADPKGRRGPRYRWEGDGCLAVGYLLDPTEKEILYAGIGEART